MGLFLNEAKRDIADAFKKENKLGRSMMVGTLVVGGLFWFGLYPWMVYSMIKFSGPEYQIKRNREMTYNERILEDYGEMILNIIYTPGSGVIGVTPPWLEENPFFSLYDENKDRIVKIPDEYAGLKKRKYDLNNDGEVTLEEYWNCGKIND